MTENRGDYPGYDVLRKRDGPSWNDPTRRAVDARLAIPNKPRFFDDAEWRTLEAVCARIMPQPGGPDRANLAAMVDDKMATNRTDGYRYPGMPSQGEAWQRGLAALDSAAQKDRGLHFHDMDPAAQDDMLRSMQEDRFANDALGGMPAKGFFTARILSDVVSAYYAHPTAWSELGWSGPASPRGYVRMDVGMNDPWEPVENDERSNRRVR